MLSRRLQPSMYAWVDDAYCMVYFRLKVEGVRVGQFKNVRCSHTVSRARQLESIRLKTILPKL
jgi:hypothetical protein